MSKSSTRKQKAKIEAGLSRAGGDGGGGGGGESPSSATCEPRPEPMKVIVLGKSGTGKTCLTNRYALDQFSEMTNSTVGAAFYSRTVDVMGKTIVMGIWDTAGSERYEAMSRIYYRGARAAVVCYDLTESASFERTKFWVDELKKNVPDCRLYLCGTKKDLAVARQLPNTDAAQVQRFAAGLGAPVYFTSSKTGESINELFTRIALDYASDIAKPAPGKADADTLKLSSSHNLSYRLASSARAAEQEKRSRSGCGTCS